MQPGAPEMRVVITMCDSAASEPCPYWPGSPVTVHWGYPDPSNAAEADKRNACLLYTSPSPRDS